MTTAAANGERNSSDAASGWRDSAPLYDAFAPEWDRCFEAANHRNAYDLLVLEYLVAPRCPRGTRIGAARI